jgi:ethanolamine utilization protein EutQ (cupin superfamily)
MGVHKGAVRVTLAGRQYDAGTGATVFIPHGSWIGVEVWRMLPASLL